AESGIHVEIAGQTLPSANYTKDDISYYPAPEFRLSTASTNQGKIGYTVVKPTYESHGAVVLSQDGTQTHWSLAVNNGAMGGDNEETAKLRIAQLNKLI